jgi:hypothetical protein
MTAELNPYSAPAGAIEETTPAVQAAPALWNPNAAALWSLLFSPVFGAWLQMRNWQALGDAKKAQVSWYWCLASLVLIVALVAVGMVLPESHPLQKIGNRSGFFLLIAWYLSHGKLQVAYVKERFGKDYPRKGWAAPLAIAVGGVVVFIVAIVALGVVLSLLGLVKLPD